MIVNEFGELGIDGKLVVGTEDNVIELNNGCLCCTVRGDLIEAIRRLLQSGRPLKRIVIETSGLADPGPVIQSFILDPVLAEHVALDAIVTVVDARHIRGQLSQDEAAEQVGLCRRAAAQQGRSRAGPRRRRIETELRRRNALARIIERNPATWRPRQCSTSAPSISRTC